MSILDRPRSLVPRVRDASPPLDDSSKFVRLPNVALLDEHYRTTDRDGERIREYIGVDQLEVICENTQRRCEAGDYPLIFLGHTDYRKQEKDFPKRVGYLSNIQMGLDNRDRPVIMADLYVDRPDYEAGVVDQNPRRSVEMFSKQTPSGYIDALALLKRSPERDLGLVTYSKQDECEIEYYTCRECREELGDVSGDAGDTGTQGGRMAIESADLKMIVEAIVGPLVSGITGGLQDWFMRMADPGMGAGEAGDEGMAGEAGDADGDGIPDEADADADGDGVPDALEDEAGVDERMAAEDAEAPEAMDAGGAAVAPGLPSGTDTNVPPPIKPKKKPPMREKVDMSSEEDKIEIAALKRNLAKQTARVEALERESTANIERYQTSERKLRLKKVIDDNKLDVVFEEEFDDVKDLNPAQFDRHLQRIPARYSKRPDAFDDVPLDRSTMTVRRDDRPDEPEIEPSEYGDVVRYAKREQIDLNTPKGPVEAMKGYLAAKAAKKNGTANGHGSRTTATV